MKNTFFTFLLLENSFALIAHLSVRDNSSNIQAKGPKLPHRLRKVVVFFYSIWSFDNEKSLTRCTHKHTWIGYLPHPTSAKTRPLTLPTHTRRTSMKHWLWVGGRSHNPTFRRAAREARPVYYRLPLLTPPPPAPFTSQRVLHVITDFCFTSSSSILSISSSLFFWEISFGQPILVQHHHLLPFCWNVSNYTFRPSLVSLLLRSVASSLHKINFCFDLHAPNAKAKGKNDSQSSATNTGSRTFGQSSRGIFFTLAFLFFRSTVAASPPVHKPAS